MYDSVDVVRRKTGLDLTSDYPEVCSYLGYSASMPDVGAADLGYVICSVVA